MTCGEAIKRIASYDFLASVDYIEGIISVVCVIIIMEYLFGQEGKMTVKAILPIIVFVSVGIILRIVSYAIDYSVLSKRANEIYDESIYLISREEKVVSIGRIIYFIAIVMSGMRVFKKKKLINSISLLVFAIFFIEYVMVMSINVVAYWEEDPRIAYGDVKKMDLTSNNYLLEYALIMSVLAILIFILMTLYFGFVKKKRKMYVAWKYRIFFIIWEIFTLLIHWIPFNRELSVDEHYRYVGYELGIFIPFLGLVIPLFLVTLISRRYTMEKVKIQENYILAELDYLKQYKNDQNETRTFRHDIISNLATLSTMYSEEKYDEAGKYLSNLLGNIKAMSPKYITGDEMLDCIVGMKISKMEEVGIDFTLDGVLDGGLKMKPVDICTIFANAIDNAIEACERLPEESDRWIKLKIKRTDKFFSISLINSMVEDKKTGVINKIFYDGERFTTKKDKSLHGYGTKNMKAAISRYDGIERVSAEGGVFTLSIILPRA
ncbi:sensor histidine kinase [Eubacterium ruminantium]|uniref:sensor histidine kinase n=1 Tax=Eubacterium ruminantium TaxID=42322 RepID=UPI0024794C4A|nr:sensor histidine kinase [Eubacterium ruminantium]